MRLTFTFLIICLIISCKSNIRQNENSSQVLNKDNCPEKTYTKNLDGFRLDAIYYECEPGWKSHLKIYHGDRLIYTADTLTEFDFNKVSWPDFLKVSNDTSQILLEVDDRPSINYILCLTIVNNKILLKENLPLMENSPRDYDNDGFLEFSGYLCLTEGYTEDSCYYNPICFVENGSKGFRLDTDLTKRVNTNLYGGFHGFKCNEKLIVKEAPKDSLDKYLIK